MHQDLRGTGLAAGIVSLALVYVATAWVGFEVAVVAEQVTLVWAPSGIALAAVVLGGTRLASGVLLGALVANLTTDVPVVTALAIAVGNTLEALLGAYFLRRVAFRPRVDRLRDALGLIFLAGALSTTVSATTGSVSLCVSGVQPWSAFAVLWRDWWLGDTTGVLVVAPMLLTWLGAPRPRWTPRDAAQASVLLVVLLIVGAVSFGPPSGTVLSAYPVHYLAFPVVIWAALRFGPRGAASVVFFLAAVSVIGMTQGFGPALLRATSERLLLVQLFIAVVASTGLLLGAAIAERNATHEALRASDRKKTEFLATLAHELRNPLAPIAGAVELLRGETDRAAAERLRRTIERQSTNLVRLVDDLLDVSRITSGKVHLRKRRVDFAEVLENAIEISRPHIESRAQTLEVEMPHSIRLEGDPTRLAQVISNLLNNAASNGVQGGHIWLSAHASRGEVVIRVRDDGAGMTRDDLAHVFELFAQGRGTGRMSGLGIGLTLAKHLVTLHGGSITAESGGAGQGSEFTVRLPGVHAELDPAPSGGSPATTPRAALPAALRILVVDDNVDAAEMLAALLEGRGHDVHVAFDGTSALAQVRDSVPDVVLLDIEMPGMSGLEVARALRSDPRCDGARIIAVSGYGQARDCERSRAAGFDVHMVKPVQPETLYAEIEMPERAEHRGA
jgi:signal transduction histidine kinase/ActR/RegA family two-component response regulator